MQIWYDALTGKHVRYACALANTLRLHGHQLLLTSRKHPDTISVANILKEKFVFVGEYRPESLYTRLKTGLERMQYFTEKFEGNPPELAISHQSPDLCRVAFGLGIPIITTADTPYASAVCKLSVPFSNVLVISSCLPKKYYRSFGCKKIVTFGGVDEVAWAQKQRPLELNLKRPVIVVRQLETGAAYATEKTDYTAEIARKLSEFGTVIFLRRYQNHIVITRGRSVACGSKFADSVRLAFSADLLVGVGGTLAREAALQGTPSIIISTFEKQYVNDYLAEKGFPIFTVAKSEVVRCAKKYAGQKFDVANKFSSLENPVKVIAGIIAKRKFNQQK